MKAHYYIFCSLLILGQSVLSGQSGTSASDILHNLQKLQNTTRVLYLAAHPDDENTRMISWLENDRHMRTAYLSLTRGDGGQNLVGTELGAKLGVLRTQELMQARAIDGGEQFFTRAVDFGYSKTADETFRQWNRDEVLADVVWVIRSYRPDMIITRFPPDARAGHGHHTASAMLALEAFDLAADPKAYPDQLEYTDTWQVKRLFWNHSTWWRQNLDSIAAADDRYTVVDVGTYNSVLGMSCNELASYSRSQHKSQGFGVSVRRGSSKEYLQLLKGDKVKVDITDGITQGWERYGWKEGDRMLEDLISQFDPVRPAASVSLMLQIMKSSESITDNEVKAWFQKEMSDQLALILGLHVEAVSEMEFLPMGALANVELQMINRSNLPVDFLGLEINGDFQPSELGDNGMIYNQVLTHRFSLELPEKSSQPYWLNQPYDKMFVVDDQELIGMPENGRQINLDVVLGIDGERLVLRPALRYKFTDRVDGEVLRPAVVVPEVVVNVAESNLVFVDDKYQSLEIEFQSFDDTDHSIELRAEGWQVNPSKIDLKASAEKGWKSLVVTVTPLETSEISSRTGVMDRR